MSCMLALNARQTERSVNANQKTASLGGGRKVPVVSTKVEIVNVKADFHACFVFYS